MSRATEVLAEAGLEGSDLSTCLSVFVLRYTAMHARRPMSAMVGSLRTATEGMTHLERNTYLQERFGHDAIRAAQVLIERY
jgi:hypothetical protein